MSELRDYQKTALRFAMQKSSLKVIADAYGRTVRAEVLNDWKIANDTRAKIESKFMTYQSKETIPPAMVVFGVVVGMFVFVAAIAVANSGALAIPVRDVLQFIR